MCRPDARLWVLSASIHCICRLGTWQPLPPRLLGLRAGAGTWVALGAFPPRFAYGLGRAVLPLFSPPSIPITPPWWASKPGLSAQGRIKRPSWCRALAGGGKGSPVVANRFWRSPDGLRFGARSNQTSKEMRFRGDSNLQAVSGGHLPLCPRPSPVSLRGLATVRRRPGCVAPEARVSASTPSPRSGVCALVLLACALLPRACKVCRGKLFKA